LHRLQRLKLNHDERLSNFAFNVKLRLYAMALLNREGTVKFTEEEWKSKLEPFPYQVLRREATERQDS